MNILVTGATGFIGTNLAKTLIGTDHELFFLDTKRFPRGIEKEIITKYEKYKYNDPSNKIYHSAVEITGDLSDPQCKMFLPKDIDVIFHLAAQQPNNPDLEFDDYLKGNLLTTRHLLEFYKDKGVKAFIYTSTILSGNTDYLCTKRFAELLIHEFRDIFKYKPLILNLASVIGKDQKGGFVHDFYKQAKANEVITVYGNGLPWRSLIHVDDVIQVFQNILKIIENDISIDRYRSFDICTPESWRLKEIAKYIRDQIYSESQIVFSDKRAVSIKGSNYESEMCLGFKPMGLMSSLHKYINEMEAKS